MTNYTHIRCATALLAILVAALPHTSRACAVCMGASDSTVAPAMNAAIFLMLGLIGAMLAGIGGFAFCLYKRSKLPRAPHEELTEIIHHEGHHRHA